MEEFEGHGEHTTVSSEVAAVIGVAPVADLTEFARRPGMARLFGAHPAAEIVQAASPITYANRTIHQPCSFTDCRRPGAAHDDHAAVSGAGAGGGASGPAPVRRARSLLRPGTPFCEAIADAMACFMARYAPARATVTTA